jgi:excisionase family DNA binding protein
LTRRRLTVAEAAGELGISQDAVRMRIKRGTLEAERDGRQVLVLLDSVRSGVGSHPDSSALISRLEDEVRFLREELARKDAILLRMAESVPQLEAPSPTKSSEISDPTEAPSSAGGGAQEGSERPQERRGFWSRLFGG